MPGGEANEFSLLRAWAEAQVGPQAAPAVGGPAGEAHALGRELEIERIENAALKERITATRGELAAALLRFDDLYNGAPIGFFLIERSGRVQDANAAALRMLGAERGRVIGARLQGFLHAADGPRLLAAAGAATGGRVAGGIDLRLIRADGQEVETHAEIFPFSMSAEDEGGVCVAVIDISRVNRVERTSELQSRAIENLAEGVLITDGGPAWPDGRIVFVNEGMHQITGYSREELIGAAPRIFHGPETDPKVRAHIREQLTEGRSVRAEVVHRRKDGRPIEVELYAAPVRWDGGNVTHTIAIYSDISGRRQLGRELLDRQARLRAVLDTAVESIITIDERGVIEDFNPAAEQLFGYRAEEMIGRNVNVLMPSPYREEHDGYLEAYLKTGLRKIIGIGREVEAQKRDGSVFPIELSVSELQVSGRTMFTGIIRDITERKAHEKAAGLWREELEARVEQSTRDLKLANQELRELNFFISHDLKAPLRAMRNYVDFLVEDLEGQIEGPALEDLRHLQKAEEELQAMVDDLLAYSRLGQERNLTPTEINVARLIGSIASQFTSRSKHRVRVEGVLPNLRAPEVLVRQVFQNLIENGLKYNTSPEPEVRVSVRPMNPEAGWWEFAIRDNGIGIDGKHHADIFRMFRRLHGSDEYVGTGIGLASVKKAVQMLGGSIRVESEPGQGSTFYVKLPETPRGA